MATPQENGGAPLEFGKYRLHRLIGRGGMGEVYLATLAGEFGFEKRLVVKTILPELAKDENFVEMFATEAKTAVALSHGNIVPIYELGRSEDTFYIAMGYVEGPSVAQLLQAYRSRSAAAEIAGTLFIIREVLTGLAYAHTPEPSRPAVVHRDVSPRNVLIDRSGQVRIVDFGIALPGGVQVRARMGSTGYMSPEQARGEAADPRADVFSVGCLLYELLTLDKAYPTEGVWSQPNTQALPDGLGPIVARTLSIDPAERPADAGAFLDALGPVLRKHAGEFAEHDLAKHLRELFPSGWDHVDEPPSSGTTVTPVTRMRRPTHTFATKLTPLAPRTGDRESPASNSARPRARWLGLGLAAAATAAAFGWVMTQGPAQSDPRPSPRPQPANPTPRDASSAPSDPPVQVEVTSVAPFRLTVTPPDATVLLDDKRLQGSSPYALAIPGGETRTVTITAEGFKAREVELRGEDGEHNVQLDPLRPGTLDIRAPEVNWASIYVDGEHVGVTPRAIELPEGKHRVRLHCTSACDHPRDLYNGTVTVKPGKTVVVKP